MVEIDERRLHISVCCGYSFKHSNATTLTFGNINVAVCSVLVNGDTSTKSGGGTLASIAWRIPAGRALVLVGPWVNVPKGNITDIDGINDAKTGQPANAIRYNMFGFFRQCVEVDCDLAKNRRQHIPQGHHTLLR